MVEDGGAKLDNAGEFALEKLSRESGTGWWDIGLVNIRAATGAIAAATEAHALSIDPHAVDSMLAKLAAMRDELDRVTMRSTLVGSRTPLGGGYAEEVGQINREMGNEVLTRIIPQLVRAISDLGAEIEKSRASYQNMDAANQAKMDDIRGSIQS
ncbi:hypothetical protein ACIQMJ_35605 [Actinosynnema sp. NPDC091369]